MPLWLLAVVVVALLLLLSAEIASFSMDISSQTIGKPDRMPACSSAASATHRATTKRVGGERQANIISTTTHSKTTQVH